MTAPTRRTLGNFRSTEPVRSLTAADLNLPVTEVVEVPDVTSPDVLGTPSLEADHPLLRQVLQLLRDGFGGVVLRGPPGTSKSWFARGVANYLAAGVPERVHVVQFHSSYQYEDFVEGYVPTESGFKKADKHLLRVCEMARVAHQDDTHVLLIDELSRADPSRVFGEALTYIERSKRGQKFFLASGKETDVPKNLVIIGTMNEFDRGVLQVDEALERRLAFIKMEADADYLLEILQRNAVEQRTADRIVQFFEQTLEKHPNPRCRIGHAYFRTVVDSASLRRLWDHQLRFVLERAFPFGATEEFTELERRWGQLVAEIEGLETGGAQEGTQLQQDLQTPQVETPPGA